MQIDVAQVKSNVLEQYLLRDDYKDNHDVIECY